MMRGCGAVVVTGILSASMIAALAAPASTASRFERVAVLNAGIQDAFAVDASHRRLIAIRGETGVPLHLTFYDATRFRPVRSIEFPGYFNQGFATGKPTVFALDDARRLLYVVAYRSVQEQANTIRPLLLAIDIDRLSVVERTLDTLFPGGIRPLGIRLTPAGSLLIVGQATPNVVLSDAPRATGVIAAEIDPSRAGTAGSPQVVWGPVPVRGCQALITSRSQSVIVRSGRTIFLGCGTSTALVVPLPGVPAVIALPMDEPSNVTASFLPGSYAFGDLYVDEPSRRLLLVGSAPGRPAQAVWVFDMDRRLFLGQVAAGDLNVLASGVHPSTGRLYVAISDQQGAGAVLVGSDRGLEIAQAISVPARPISGVITPLPFSNHVIVPTEGRAGPQYAVYRDLIPATAIAPGIPLDYSVIDRTKTETPQFSAGAQAFGIRVHELGGVNGVGQNVVPNSNINYWGQAGTATELRDGDRDFAFARVGTAHLSDADAAASAVSSLADENTDHDHQRLTGTNLSVPEASCRDFGSGDTRDQTEGAEVSCAQRSGVVKATASWSRVRNEVVTIGWARSTTELRTVGSGVSAVARSEAHDIVIGGVATIGSLTTQALAKASGTERRAIASYTRTIRNVNAGTFSCADECNLQAALAAITAAVGAQIRVEFPAEEVHKTPKGGHAHALRERWEHQQDIVINNQPVTEHQVPG
ncbi:MAG: hypothetical protein ACRDJM_02740, partial [Actinomycetota bacterium]